MAAPNIWIDLDPGPWTEPEWKDYYTCGGAVSGRVRILADEPVNCRGVRLTVGWHTEGRGDRDEGKVHEETVHEGELPTGDHTFPFSARLPQEGPISYAGHYINIVWRATAHIDLAWRRDPTAEKVFYVALP